MIHLLVAPLRRPYTAGVRLGQEYGIFRPEPTGRQKHHDQQDQSALPGPRNRAIIGDLRAPALPAVRPRQTNSAATRDHEVAWAGAAVGLPLPTVRYISRLPLTPTKAKSARAASSIPSLERLE